MDGTNNLRPPEGDPYRRVAGLYDAIFERMNLGLRRIGVGMKRPQHGMQVLDIGCGTGAHLELYKKHGCDLYGIDTSPSMLDVARKKLGDGAVLKIADAGNIPFDDETFDLVLSMLTLHEMDPEIRSAATREAARVTKRDGRILFIDYRKGRLTFPSGWFAKSIIFVAELAAGKRHFRNYRQHLSTGGLTGQIDKKVFAIEQQKVVAGGAFSLVLLKKAV